MRASYLVGRGFVVVLVRAAAIISSGFAAAAIDHSRMFDAVAVVIIPAVVVIIIPRGSLNTKWLEAESLHSRQNLAPLSEI